MEKIIAMDLFELIKGGDRRALAKAITIVENQYDNWKELLNKCYKNMSDQALVIGVTGPGGAGKSTLIDKLIKVYRDKGLNVGVIAVDPSSPYSGGSFLGDRIRMGSHSMDNGVFIRSFSSRGNVGGISSGTKKVLYLYKAFNFDIIILESLGIGQDETEITNFVDVTLVTLVPGFGDSVQMAKSGMQEIADIFIVNKSDKPDAERFLHQLESSINLRNLLVPPKVLCTVACDNIGIQEVVHEIEVLRNEQFDKRHIKYIKRIEIEIRTEVMSLLEEKLYHSIKDKKEIVINNNKTPFEVADEIVKDIINSK